MPAKSKAKTKQPTYTVADLIICQSRNLTSTEVNRVYEMAKQRFSPAMLQMGHLHAGHTTSETTLAKDPERALDFYNQAAAAGHPDGYYNAAREMEKREKPLTFETFTECLFHYEIAANRFGHSYAAYRLFAMCSNNLEFTKMHHLPAEYLYDHLAKAALTIPEAMVVLSAQLMSDAARHGDESAIHYNKAINRAVKSLNRKLSQSK